MKEQVLSGRTGPACFQNPQKKTNKTPRSCKETVERLKVSHGLKTLIETSLK